VKKRNFSWAKLTRRVVILSSDAPAFSMETLLLPADRRRVGEPVEGMADILMGLLERIFEKMVVSQTDDTVSWSRSKRNCQISRRVGGVRVDVKERKAEINRTNTSRSSR